MVRLPPVRAVKPSFHSPTYYYLPTPKDSALIQALLEIYSFSYLRIALQFRHCLKSIDPDPFQETDSNIIDVTCCCFSQALQVNLSVAVKYTYIIKLK